MYKFQPVLELLRNKSVADIKNAFGEDYGTETGINFDSFYNLLQSELGLDVKESDVKHLFCQIDHYSKETVTSTELDNYLVHYEKKRTLPNEGPFENKPTMYPGVRCQDSIIEWIMYPEEPDVRDEVAGHYIYLSRHGILSIWTKDMTKRFETTFATIDDGIASKSTTWATSLTCLPKEKLLAVSTTAGDIRFFRCSTYKFEHKFSIVCLPSLVLRLNCFASHRLICGDFAGSAFIVHMEKVFFTRNRRRASHLVPERIQFDQLKLGRITGLSFEGTTKAHFSPIQQVEYVPSLDAVISCSVSTKRALLVHFLENNESLSFGSLGGINCFAYCHRLHCIATGCVDQSIKIWNPTVNTSYNESLSAHTSPVNHVLVDENRLFLISADREKIVRVWDLLRPKCLQVIKFTEAEFPGKHSFASVFLDITGKLILTTYNIGKLEFYRAETREKTHPCSEYLVLADYSNVFNTLVTVGNASTVAVWDCESGSLIYEFEKTHEVLDSDGLPQIMSVMVASLDPSGRRLITADRVGMIKVWNFYLGLRLQSFQVNFIVLSLTFLGFHIYVAGSSGMVIDFHDNGTPESLDPETWDKHHLKSIVSVDCYRKNLLASASCDGEIILWIRMITDPKFHLKDLKEDEQETKEGQDYLTEVEKRRRCSISQILFLQKREMDYFVGNLVSCGMDGRIRFWNIVCTSKVNEGSLLSKFRGVFRDCDGVLCLATDLENRYIITGDTMGYVRIYELDGYYSVYGSAPPRSHHASPQLLDKFPFLRLQTMVKQKHPESSKFPDDGGAELGFAPFILNCFRAHLGAVVQINYIDGKDLLITAGRKGSVRLWSLSGAYVGRLGPPGETWNLTVVEKKSSHMPPDIRAVASALTLFVMNNGGTPHWTSALESLRECRLGHQPEGFSEKPLRWGFKKSVHLEDLSKSETLEEDLMKRLPRFRGTRICKQKFFQDIDTDV